jgi:hypothetical protein
VGDYDDGFWDDYYAEHPIQQRFDRADDFINNRGCGFWGALFVVILLALVAAIIELAVPGGIAEVIQRLGKPGP